MNNKIKIKTTNGPQVHWNGVAEGLSRGRTIALQYANICTAEEGNKRWSCRTTNDCTRDAIDRSYREWNLRTERELEKKIKIQKLKIKKRKNN
jgi:hypothetical protein